MQCFLKDAVGHPSLEVECGAVIKALFVAFKKKKKQKLNQKEQSCFMLSTYIGEF